jgi:multimeric flavodoxin WrbA
MNIVTLLASPRADGNTARILNWVEVDLHELGHDTERIDLTELTIGGCTSCYACVDSADAPGCAVSDDAQAIFRKLIAADGIIYATPLYMWGVTAQLKALLDRSLCLVRDYGSPDHRSFVEGRRAALVLTCGGPEEGNAEAVTTMFPRFAEFLKLDNRGAFVFPHCGEPRRLPNTHGAKARALAGLLAEWLSTPPAAEPDAYSSVRLSHTVVARL